MLRSTGAKLDVTFSAGDADGAVTVTVSRADGTAIATDAAATNEAAAGHYSYTLAPQDDVDRLTLEWTGTFSGAVTTVTTHAEIVGGHLFTVAEARAFDDTALSDTVKYPDATIRTVRDGITDFFEAVTGVSFVRRYGEATVDGPGGADLWLSVKQLHALLSASVDGTALTSDELAEVEVYESGRLYRANEWAGGWGSTHRTVEVAYEHGYESVPWEIHRAALVLARYSLVTSDVSDRTISWSNELGTFRQSFAGPGRPTGIPAVDAALERYTPSKGLLLR